MKIKVSSYVTFNFRNNTYRAPMVIEMDEKNSKDFINFLNLKSIPYRILEDKSMVENADDEILISKFKTGYVKDPEDERDFLFKTVGNLRADLPDIVDYTSEMSPVKDQGQAGTCVGMAVTAVKEWQEQKEYIQEIKEGKKYRRRKPYYDLSEQWAYYKAKEIDPWPDQEGTSIRFALKQICKLGIPPEKAWPYNDREKGFPKPWAAMIARWGKGKSYYRINNLDELLVALHDHGPCVIGILCFREIFTTGSDGIVKDPANPNQVYGGHAVAAVGYNKEKQLVKFKNSWGTFWGENGYGYISFNYVNNYMMDAWVLIDENVTKDELKNK